MESRADEELGCLPEIEVIYLSGDLAKDSRDGN
jgi:hypothetical protein